eukprot:837252_1
MIGIVQRFALQSHACMRSTIVAIDPIDPILIQPRIQEIQIVPLPYTSNEQKKHRTSCINKKRHQTGCVSNRSHPDPTAHPRNPDRTSSIHIKRAEEAPNELY